MTDCAIVSKGAIDHNWQLSVEIVRMLLQMRSAVPAAVSLQSLPAHDESPPETSLVEFALIDNVLSLAKFRLPRHFACHLLITAMSKRVSSLLGELTGVFEEREREFEQV